MTPENIFSIATVVGVLVVTHTCSLCVFSIATMVILSLSSLSLDTCIHILYLLCRYRGHMQSYSLYYVGVHTLSLFSIATVVLAVTHTYPIYAYLLSMFSVATVMGVLVVMHTYILYIFSVGVHSLSIFSVAAVVGVHSPLSSLSLFICPYGSQI
jgi:hypothetical protein